MQATPPPPTPTVQFGPGTPASRARIKGMALEPSCVRFSPNHLWGQERITYQNPLNRDTHSSNQCRHCRVVRNTIVYGSKGRDNFIGYQNVYQSHG